MMFMMTIPPTPSEIIEMAVIRANAPALIPFQIPSRALAVTSENGSGSL